MKKVLTLAFLALGFMFANTANAQGLKFGLKAGLNVTDMHLNSEVFDKTNRAGWFVGPTVKFSLPLLGLGVDASALYDCRSAKIANPKLEERDIKQQQITIPVSLRYSIGLGSSANVFVFAGPQWGFNVGEKDFKWTSGSSYSLKKSNFSVNAGLGFTVLNHLQVSANYNIACGKTADLKILDAVSDAAQQVAGLKSKSRNNSWQIALAYYF